MRAPCLRTRGPLRCAVAPPERVSSAVALLRLRRPVADYVVWPRRRRTSGSVSTRGSDRDREVSPAGKVRAIFACVQMRWSRSVIFTDVHMSICIYDYLYNIYYINYINYNYVPTRALATRACTGRLDDRAPRWTGRLDVLQAAWPTHKAPS